MVGNMIIDFIRTFFPDKAIFSKSKFHSHVLAKSSFGRSPPHTIENVLHAAKVGGVDISVISNPLHDMRDMDREQQLETIKRHNRFVAAQQEKYDSIYGFASAVPYGDDRFHREFERAIKEDGLKGAWITSSLQGQYPDDDEALPFFQLAVDLDVPVVVHPPSVALAKAHARLSPGIKHRTTNGWCVGDRQVYRTGRV